MATFLCSVRTCQLKKQPNQTIEISELTDLSKRDIERPPIHKNKSQSKSWTKTQVLLRLPTESIDDWKPALTDDDNLTRWLEQAPTDSPTRHKASILESSEDENQQWRIDREIPSKGVTVSKALPFGTPSSRLFEDDEFTD